MSPALLEFAAQPELEILVMYDHAHRSEQERNRPKWQGVLVHFYTALGVVCALGAAVAIATERYPNAFFWLLLAAIIDGSDGTLARKFSVERTLPEVWIASRCCSYFKDRNNSDHKPLLERRSEESLNSNRSFFHCHRYELLVGVTCIAGLITSSYFLSTILVVAARND